ncbi:hypothetical protein [Frigoribacterium sp. R86507]
MHDSRVQCLSPAASDRVVGESARSTILDALPDYLFLRGGTR